MTSRRKSEEAKEREGEVTKLKNIIYYLDNRLNEVNDSINIYEHHMRDNEKIYTKNPSGNGKRINDFIPILNQLKVQKQDIKNELFKYYEKLENMREVLTKDDINNLGLNLNYGRELYRLSKKSKESSLKKKSKKKFKKSRSKKKALKYRFY